MQLENDLKRRTFIAFINIYATMEIYYGDIKREAILIYTNK